MNPTNPTKHTPQQNNKKYTRGNRTTLDFWSALKSLFG